MGVGGEILLESAPLPPQPPCGYVDPALAELSLYRYHLSYKMSVAVEDQQMSAYGNSGATYGYAVGEISYYKTPYFSIALNICGMVVCWVGISI